MAGVPPLHLDQVPVEVYVVRGFCEPRTILETAVCPPAMLRTAAWCIEDFHLHKQLYKGKASLLYSATCRLSGLPVALKLYRKNKLSNLNWFQVEREIRIHGQVVHEHIIRLYGAFEDTENVYLAQEYAPGGDLYEELKRHGGRLPEDRVATRIVGPCMQALAYLHKLGIIHRDIKSENILLASDGTIKLADFGLSINHREERPVTRAGTLDMMAPEVLVCPEKSRPEENKDREILGYTDGVDVWALGIVAFELLVGHPPFERESRSETYEHIMYRAPAMPALLSTGAKGFITAALVKAVSKRPSMEELLTHSWLRKSISGDLAAPLTATGVAQKAEPTTSSVKITVDCTIGRSNTSTADSEASSSAPSAEGRAACGQQAEDSKPSVLQWAGSSLRTITKRLRKPATSLPTERAGGLADRQNSMRTPRHKQEPLRPIEQHLEGRSHTGGPTLRMQDFKICSPVRAASSGPGVPVDVSCGPLAEAASTHPLRLSHSLASLVISTAAAEEQQKPSPSQYSPGFKQAPCSPPAYLTRPWLQPLPRAISRLEQPTSPTLQMPSPLARRRRRIAGIVDTSSSGSMNLADTPKGGKFPSGARSARTFGRGGHKYSGSPTKRATGESMGDSLRFQPASPKGARSSHAQPMAGSSPEQAFASPTMPRKMSASFREGVLSRAASATPGCSATHKLRLGSPKRDNSLPLRGVQLDQ